MRKGLLLTAVLGACLSVSSLADERLPKYLIDGYFFNELPFDITHQSVDMMSVSDQDGNRIYAVSGVTLSDNQKRHAIRKEDVPNADFWIKEAKNRAWIKSINEDNQAQKTRIAEGDTIGQFCVKDIDGRVWDNASTKGHALVLNFWYIGCGPCIKEMPEISKWKDECPDVNFLAVTYNSFDEIKDIVKRQNFRFTQVTDNKTLWEMFGVSLTPTTVLVDKDGVVRKVTTGINNGMLRAIKEVSAGDGSDR